MAKSSRDVVRIFLNDGWFEIGQTGSHRHFKHPSKPGKVTVPHPRRDLSIKTLHSIARQAGVDLD